MKRGELIVAMTRGEAIFQQLKKQYPALKGYLVFSLPSGQCDLTDNMEDILSEFPGMIQDSKAKAEAVSLISKKVSIQQLLKKEELDIKEDTSIEIRFKDQVIFDLIFALQKDPLVSQEHTPQTRASIRIVLGRIGDLYRAGKAEI